MVLCTVSPVGKFRGAGNLMLCEDRAGKRGGGDPGSLAQTLRSQSLEGLINFGTYCQVISSHLKSGSIDLIVGQGGDQGGSSLSRRYQKLCSLSEVAKKLRRTNQ